MKKLLILFGLLATLLSLAACGGDLGYYLQCATGHIDVMHRSVPISNLVANPQTPEKLKLRLEKVQQMRDFAIFELGLPDNDSYRSYADLDRPYVVWNLVAAKEFSLQPKKWCFPVAGCVSYKGYFHKDAATEQAQELRKDGYEVDLYGVQAYSTLSWFADPVLNTFINASETRLAGLLFHELAHQVVYIKGDSAFNEAFAMTVQMEGVRRWLQSQASTDQWQRYLDHERQVTLFQHFLRETRQKLADLYARDLPVEEMRRQKQEIIASALQHYQDLKKTGTIDERFDRWMAQGLNNARLASVATYRDLLPGFQNLLSSCNGDLKLFYQKVEELSRLPRQQRLATLQQGPPPKA